MLYYILIAFQAFCIFHAYRSRNDYYWYFVIFFVPVIGGLVYFFSQIITRTNIKKGIKSIQIIINPRKNIEDLEKKLSQSNTIQNQIYLADAYFENKEYGKAINYYEMALIGNFHKKSHTLNKAAKCYFQIKRYDKVVEYVSQLDLDNAFRNTIFIYAVALEKCENYEEAEIQFKKANKKYSNYGERLELSKFLIRRSKGAEAKIILKELCLEIDNMNDINKTKYDVIYKKSSRLIKKI